MATKQERLDSLNAILEAGISSTTRGGREIKYDLEAVAKERDRLARELSGNTIRRGRYNPYYRT